ncbi:helix-turn-helix domain-containing protein [Zavarzinella formosa]|uniref:helix-turn-helix domain-containing protein n=1 Tax=Zavarzinella formosa TaxID=360055 RepID=UPI0002D6E02C|nr:helix-turn-helix domain-containing protein [Zavarzinella formosa]
MHSLIESALPTRPDGSPWPAKEAAGYLRISYRHLLRLIDAGKVKSIRYGRKLLVPSHELERLAKEGAK